MTLEVLRRSTRCAAQRRVPEDRPIPRGTVRPSSRRRKALESPHCIRVGLRSCSSLFTFATNIFTLFIQGQFTGQLPEPLQAPVIQSSDKSRDDSIDLTYRLL